MRSCGTPHVSNKSIILLTYINRVVFSRYLTAPGLRFGADIFVCWELTRSRGLFVWRTSVVDAKINYRNLHQLRPHGPRPFLWEKHKGEAKQQDECKQHAR